MFQRLQIYCLHSVFWFLYVLLEHLGEVTKRSISSQCVYGPHITIPYLRITSTTFLQVPEPLHSRPDFAIEQRMCVHLEPRNQHSSIIGL